MQIHMLTYLNESCPPPPWKEAYVILETSPIPRVVVICLSPIISYNPTCRGGWLFRANIILQYNTIQCNKIQCDAMQCNTIQYITIQYNIIHYDTIQYLKIQYKSMQYNTIK